MKIELKVQFLYSTLLIKCLNIFFFFKETLEAIHRLSSCLNVQPSAFSFAGIKDKKAITKQYMVVKGVTPEQ